MKRKKLKRELRKQQCQLAAVQAQIDQIMVELRPAREDMWISLSYENDRWGEGCCGESKGLVVAEGDGYDFCAILMAHQ